MPDTPIVDSNNNNNNNNFDIVGTLTIIVDAINTFSNSIKEIKDIIVKNSTNKNDAETRKLNAEIAQKQREIDSEYKRLTAGFTKLQKLQNDDNEYVKKLSDVLGKSVGNITNIYQKGNETASALAESKIVLTNLYNKLAKTAKNSDDEKALEAEISNMSSKIHNLAETYDELQDELISENSKQTSKILNKFIELLKQGKTADEAYKSIEKELNEFIEQQDEEDKRKAKQKKIENAKNYKIWNDIKDSFEDGLFALPGKLSSVFEKGIQNNVDAISGSLTGKIIGFAEKSLFSMMDYQTTKTVEAISNLQSTFESTGQTLARAIMTDTDDIKESWKEISDRLQQEGYDQALSVLDIAQLQDVASKAGITNLDELNTITYTSGVLKSKTGVEAADFLSSENLMYLHNIYREMMSSGASVSDFENVMTDFAAQLTGAVKSEDTAIAFAEGKSQDLLTKYLRDIQYYNYDTDRAKTISASRVAGQAAFGNVGAQSIYAQMITGLENLKQTGITEGSEIFNILSGMGTLEDFKNADYTEFIKKSVETLFDVRDITGDTGATVLLRDVFNINAEDFENFKNTYGSYENFANRLDAIEKNVKSDKALTENTRLVKEGATSTTRTQIENQALNDVTNIWSHWADIPNGAEMLKASIQTSTKALEWAISEGVKLLLTGNLAGSMTNAFASISGTVSKIGTSLSGTVTNIGTSLSGIGTVLGVGAIAIPIGYGVSKLIDLATENINVVPTEESMENLTKIEEANKEANEKFQQQLITKFDDTLSELTGLKGESETIAKDITSITDARQNYASTIRKRINEGDLEYRDGLNEEEQGRTINLADLANMSDADVVNYMEANKDLFNISGMDTDLRTDFNQASNAYTDKINELTGTVINTSLKNILSDSKITTEESTALAQDVNNLINQLASEGIDASSLVNNYAGLETEMKVFAAANALKTLLERETEINSGSAMSIYGTTDKDTIYKTAKQHLLSGNVQQWVAKRSDVLAIQYSGLWDKVLKYIDPNKSMSEDNIQVAVPENWYDAFSEGTISKFATGIDYIPFDNYPALLHKGERVKTDAEARLEDIMDVSRYYGSNTDNGINNNEDLTTTNNSIKEGFDTNAENLAVIIEALKAILSALNKNNNDFNISSLFSEISEDKTALRGNNMARIASTH